MNYVKLAKLMNSYSIRELLATTPQNLYIIRRYTPQILNEFCELIVNLDYDSIVEESQYYKIDEVIPMKCLIEFMNKNHNLNINLDKIYDRIANLDFAYYMQNIDGKHQIVSLNRKVVSAEYLEYYLKHENYIEDIALQLVFKNLSIFEEGDFDYADNEFANKNKQSIIDYIFYYYASNLGKNNRYFAKNCTEFKNISKMSIKEMVKIFESGDFYSKLKNEILELLIESKDQIYLNKKSLDFYTEITEKFKKLGAFEDAATKELIKSKVIELVTNNEITTDYLAENILNSLNTYISKKENVILVLEKIRSDKQAEIFANNLFLSKDEFRRLASINQDIYYFAEQIGLGIFI